MNDLLLLLLDEEIRAAEMAEVTVGLWSDQKAALDYRRLKEELICERDGVIKDLATAN
jgi:hypothetical protein